MSQLLEVQDLVKVWVVFDSTPSEKFHQIILVTADVNTALCAAFEHKPIANLVEVWLQEKGESGFLAKGVQVLEDVGKRLGSSVPSEELLDLALLVDEIREVLRDSLEVG